MNEISVSIANIQCINSSCSIFSLQQKFVYLVSAGISFVVQMDLLLTKEVVKPVDASVS